MIALVVVLGLILLFLWLRGWWFAGLLVCLIYGVYGTQQWGHSWLAAAAIGFGPWLFWYLIRDHHRLQAEKQEARRLRSGQGALALPR